MNKTIVIRSRERTALFLPDMQEAEKEVRKWCETALREKYGEEVPAPIRERLGGEFEKIAGGDTWSYYLAAAKIAEKCEMMGEYQNCRGSIGSMFTAYLLGITEVNPLPPHYYCPACKRVEFVEEREYEDGFDLIRFDTEKVKCPVCGAELTGDGHNIACEFFTGLHGEKQPDINLNISPEIAEEIYSFLEEWLGPEETPEELRKLAEEHRFATPDVLAELGLSDAVCLTILPHDMFSELKRMEEYSGVPVKSIDFADIDIFNAFFNDSMLGLPFERENLQETYEAMFPSCFSDLARISGLAHGTGTWRDNAEGLVGMICDPTEVIAFRDDVMRKLLNCGLGRAEAYRIAELVRMGKTLKELTEEDITKLREAGVEDWYIDSMRKILYLFPKAHAVEYIINYLRMAWYKIYQPAAYYAAILDNRIGENFDCSIFFMSRSEVEKELAKGAESTKELEIVLECYTRGIYFAPHFLPEPKIAVDGNKIRVSVCEYEEKNKQDNMK